jgi:hypothetical protein
VEAERPFAPDLELPGDDFGDDLIRIVVRLHLDDETIALTEQEVDATTDRDGFEPREIARLGVLSGRR